MLVNDLERAHRTIFRHLETKLLSLTVFPVWVWMVISRGDEMVIGSVMTKCVTMCVTELRSPPSLCGSEQLAKNSSHQRNEFRFLLPISTRMFAKSMCARKRAIALLPLPTLRSCYCKQYSRLRGNQAHNSCSVAWSEDYNLNMKMSLVLIAPDEPWKCCMSHKSVRWLSVQNNYRPGPAECFLYY